MKTTSFFQDRTVVDHVSGCWVWTGATLRGGYGQFQESGRTRQAHRGSWEAAFGPIPEGMLVCHKCDNPPCVNPEHLFLGTPADNMLDRDSKGRQRTPKGSNNGSAKLSEHDVSIVKTLLGLGVQGKLLATLYGVTKSTISLIKNGLLWTHIEPLNYK